VADAVSVESDLLQRVPESYPLEALMAASRQRDSKRAHQTSKKIRLQPPICGGLSRRLVAATAEPQPVAPRQRIGTGQ